MNDYCPDCGTNLNEPTDLREYWLRLLKCGQCNNTYFLEVGDSRWIYPMQRLEPGVGTKLIVASPKVVEKAASNIKRIDYKTVSIVDFEKTIIEGVVST